MIFYQNIIEMQIHTKKDEKTDYECDERSNDIQEQVLKVARQQYKQELDSSSYAMENIIENSTDLILVIQFRRSINKYSNELAFLYYINFYKWFSQIDNKLKNRNMMQDYYVTHKDRRLYCYPGDLKCLFRHKTLIKNYISYTGKTSTPPCSKQVTWLLIKDSIAINKRDIESTFENLFMFRYF